MIQNSTLYVGNLSYDTTESGLTAHFSKHGYDNVKVNVISDRETGKSRGFAFVEVPDQLSLEDVVKELNGTTLDRREIKVNMAKPREPR